MQKWKLSDVERALIVITHSSALVNTADIFVNDFLNSLSEIPL